MENTGSWRVGELAAATGLTVRTLRYWDRMGLVTPRRARSDHRRYEPADIARLYRVLALRQMGLRLDEIATVLADEDPDPRGTLREHLAAVERELAAGRDLRDRLLRVLDALERRDGHADTRLLMEAIETMTMFEQHLDTDERAKFTARREQVGEQAWEHAVREQWPQLIGEVRAEMDAGTDPAAARVQELIGRWDDLTRLFLGDDPQLRRSTGRAWHAIWAEHPDELRRSPSVAPPEMWEYLQRARQAAEQ